MPTPIFGMQGTGRWSADERPESWRQQLLRNYPRGAMPITAIMSKMGKEKVGDPAFHWWEKDFVANSAVITANRIYTDMITPTVLAVDNTAAGVTLHLLIDGTAADPLTRYVRPGSDIVFLLSSDYRACVRAVVTNVIRNGTAAEWISFRTMTADAGVDGYGLTDVDTVIVMPTVFSEFGGVPAPIGYAPSSFYNYTQIIKSSLGMSRTAMSVQNLRPDSNDWKEAKREALEILGTQMEWNTIYGIRNEATDPSNNQPIRRTMGIRQYIETYGLAANMASYKFDADFSGKSWLQGGFDWLMHKAKDLSVYCDLATTLHVVGSGVKLGLTLLAERRGTVRLEPESVEYGLAITKLITPFGTFNLVDAPLFNQSPALQYTWIGIPRGGMTYHTISDPDYGNSDVRFLPDSNYGKGGMTHVDGRFDIWLAEYGYELHRSKEWFMLSHVGEDNAV